MRTRRIAIALGSLVVAYGVACVAARLASPRLLFPAPSSDVIPPDLATSLLELPQHDGGGATRALYFPPPPGGAVVVVFHGNGETIGSEVPLGRLLARRGLGALLVEYRGYGMTHGPPPSEASLYADGEAAMEHLGSLGVRPERIAVLGFSLGTAVASEMARRGHGARLVLVAPFTSAIDMASRVAPIFPASLVMAHRLDTYGRAGAIAQPTLVAHGDADEIVPFEMGEAVAGALPRGRLLRVPGAHHGDVLRPEVVDAVVEHVAACGASPQAGDAGPD